MFTLDQRLANDTVKLASWPLCEVLLMNDKQYPWVILVPRVDEATEIFHLSDDERMQLDRESNFLSVFLMETTQGDKLNVAALGNVVSQLHIHHIVRFKTDAAWPAPVWGRHPVQAYSEQELEVIVEQFSPLHSYKW